MPQKNTDRSIVRVTRVLALVLCLSGLILAGPPASLAGESAQAPKNANASADRLPEEYEPAEPDPSVKEERQSIAKMQNRVKELEKKINTIRDNALDNNPQLETQLKDLVMTRHEVMKKNLSAENVDMEKLKELQQGMENKDVSQAEKKKLEKEFKAMYLGYKRAEMRTKQNETVQNLRKEFYSDLLEAFKEEDPKAEQLIGELSRLKHQLNYAKQEALPEKKDQE